MDKVVYVLYWPGDSFLQIAKESVLVDDVEEWNTRSFG